MVSQDLKQQGVTSSSVPNTSSGDTGDVLQDATNFLRRGKFYRKQYDQRRALFYRQYLGQRDQIFYPDNITKRSNTFVPYPLSNVETIISKVTDAFFSFMPWFEVNGRGPTDDVVCEKMQHTLHYMLKRANFIPAFEELVRNICIYGHAGIKCDWDWDYETVTYRKPIFAQQPVMQPEIDQQTGQPKLRDGRPVMHAVTDPSTGQPAMQPVINPITGQPVIIGVIPDTKQIPHARPKFIPIDIYDLLIDPDGGIIAHLTERTFGQMKREQEVFKQINPDKDLYFPQGLADIAARLASEKAPDAVIIRLAEVWNEYDGSCTLLTFAEDTDVYAWKDLRASYRATSYTPYKRKVFSGAPILLWNGANPFAHKRLPILHTSFIKLPNELYGLGAIEVISDLSEALNKFVNMITDNWNMGINHRYAIDANADIDRESLNNFNTPGGTVTVNGDPAKTIFPLPVFTPNAGDYQILDLYKGMVEMTSGISDFYSKGLGQPTGNRTATGINQVIGETNFRFKMFIRNLELDILQPLLEMCSSMVQQFITDPIEIQITGDQQPGIPKGLYVTPEDLIGSFSFDLVAANYATSKVLRQRNLMAFVGLVGQSPFWNQYEGLKEMAKVMEIRNITKLLKSPQQVQMEQQAAMAQQIKMMMLESALQTEGKARLSQAKPKSQGEGGGRPAKAQFEGKIPGAGLTSHIKGLAQSLGGNALGLEGLGEVPGAE